MSGLKKAAIGVTLATLSLVSAAKAELLLNYTFEVPDPYYPFVVDYSGNGNNSALAGDVELTYTHSKLGAYAARFSGWGGSWLTTPTLDVGPQFTIFSYLASSATLMPVFSLGGDAWGFSFGVADGRLTFRSGTSFDVRSDPQVFSLSEYHSAAVTVDTDAQSLTFYYDGHAVPVTLTYGDRPEWLYAFTRSDFGEVGSWSGYTGSSYGDREWYLDQFQIYNNVLSASEISALHSTGVVPEPAIMGLIGLTSTSLLCRRRSEAEPTA